ncbi:hypothetical protein CNYM01_10135 [Colletotrichum nymphaeae SA-01]|uniref:Uncharacterized protein n=1 Tax=Colletotrichum nymphaeae SA-01 TaxID=1460502 RepID=A0A135T6L8_9PEZI|nr:hypothetical protein CNYM01_10135 [Colletotrichum nymphaeae SA-01]
MHHHSFAIALAATGYMFGASAFPTNPPLVKMEVANSAAPVADEVDSLNHIDKRGSIFDICFKGYNPPPPVITDNISRFLNIEAARGVAPTNWEQATGNRHVQFQAWTTDNLGQFRGRVRLRFNPLFHIGGEQFRWTVSWRRGGTEGCIRGGTMSVRDQDADFSFDIDSTMEYFFTVERT